jgi:hypothetical protein
VQLVSIIIYYHTTISISSPQYFVAVTILCISHSGLKPLSLAYSLVIDPKMQIVRPPLFV